MEDHFRKAIEDSFSNYTNLKKKHLHHHQQAFNLNVVSKKYHATIPEKTHNAKKPQYNINIFPNSISIATSNTHPSLLNQSNKQMPTATFKLDSSPQMPVSINHSITNIHKKPICNKTVFSFPPLQVPCLLLKYNKIGSSNYLSLAYSNYAALQSNKMMRSLSKYNVDVIVKYAESQRLNIADSTNKNLIMKVDSLKASPNPSPNKFKCKHEKEEKSDNISIIPFAFNSLALCKKCDKYCFSLFSPLNCSKCSKKIDGYLYTNNKKSYWCLSCSNVMINEKQYCAVCKKLFNSDIVPMYTICGNKKANYHLDCIKFSKSNRSYCMPDDINITMESIFHYQISISLIS